MYKVYIKGYVGNLGTKVLIEERHDELLNYFDASYLDKVLSDINGGAHPPLFIGDENAAIEVIDREAIGKGGVLASLWKICDRNKCGIRYNLLAMPILQGTIEICNYFDLNPYRLLTDNSEILFVNCRASEPMILVGETTSDKKRIRVDNDMESYLTKDFKDEIDKIIPNYTKNYEKRSNS